MLAPTRELAVQIGDSVRTYGKYMQLNCMTIFGGSPMGKQINALGRGVDIVIATPGRLMDLLNRRKLRLDDVAVFVLDEADRMLDMGFVNDVRRIAALVGEDRQTLLFSATMPPAVAKLAQGLLTDPIRIDIAPQATTAERVSQKVLFVQKPNKRKLLSAILKDEDISRALIFTRTKHGADRVARHLAQGNVIAGVIHGNKTQNARQKALNAFKKGQSRVLVATDIAARGIDVDGVTHVINFDLPQDSETYVHRIGRTARAGASGQAISFCDAEERSYLADIEKLTRMMVEVEADHPFHAAEIADAAPTSGKPKGRSRNRNRGRNGNGGGKPNHFSKGGKKNFRPRNHKGRPQRHSGNSAQAA